jgi:hypothetical protein
VITSPTSINLTVNYAAFGRVPTGLTLQIYAGATGYSDAALIEAAPSWFEAGFTRIVRHGFVGDLSQTKFEQWAGALQEKVPGIETGASFGYAAFNRDHPDDVGKWTASVFGSSLCDLALDDAEGAFDANAKVKAYRMVQVRLEALGGRPRCPVGNQLWLAIRHHPGFPVVEWEPTTTFWGEQEYGNDFKGAHRWETCRSMRDADWSSEESDFTPNLRLPHMATIEGYGYDGDHDVAVPWEATTSLLRWPAATVWCEWKPSETMLMAARFVRYLHEHGYSLASDLSGVKAFQKDAGLTQDGLAGEATWAAAGIHR